MASLDRGLADDEKIAVPLHFEHEKTDAAGSAEITNFGNWSEDERDALNRQLIRKLDLRLLPILIIMYFFNFVDRSNLANARLGGLEADLGMSGSDFNLATSILFVGYLVMQLPANLLLTLVRPSIFLATVMTIWGALTTCTAAVSSFKGLVLVRFWLGFVEAPFFPGAMFVMSSWYTRAELGQRYAYFYAGSAIANMFNGLISAAILSHLDGSRGKHGWQWIFIISGSITIFFALLSALLLPDYPHSTRWLTETEKRFAVWRLEQDVGDADEKRVGLWAAVKMALTDWKIYLFIITQHCNLLAQTFTYFFPSIVSSLGFSPTVTLLLTAPPWAAAFLASLAVTAHASRTGARCSHIVAPILLAMVGNIMMVSTTRTAPRFVAMFLLPVGALPAFHVNMVGNVASVYGAFLWPASDAPRYIMGGATIAGACVLCACGALAIRAVLARENRARERRYGAHEEGPEKGWERTFRYLL